MSKLYLKDKFCSVCKTRFYSTNKRTINEISNSDLILKLNNVVNDNQTVKVGDLVCSKCKSIAYRLSKIQNIPTIINDNNISCQEIDHVISLESESTANDNKIDIYINEKLIPPYIQSNDSKKNVIIDTTDSTVISHEAIVDAYILKNILIPSDSRCCLSHLDECFLLTNDSLEMISFCKIETKMNK
ncbi:unnamed protein product, partial [Brachionus calyciflorus]